MRLQFSPLSRLQLRIRIVVSYVLGAVVDIDVPCAIVDRLIHVIIDSVVCDCCIIAVLFNGAVNESPIINSDAGGHSLWRLRNSGYC